MQLTEEQRKAIEWAADRFAQDAIREIDPQDKYDFNASATTLRELLAAHNAGAQPMGDDPCPFCPVGSVCETTKCGRLEQPAHRGVYQYRDTGPLETGDA